jgi:hypothetical protein
MPRWSGQAERSSKYTPLVAFIAAQKDDDVTLTFAEIEVIIGVPLSDSVQVGLSFWTRQSQRVVRDLTTIGWRARLLVPAHAVEFRRISTGIAQPEAVRSDAQS